MPRLVQKTAHGPVMVGDKAICMCGLSNNQPFCSGAHLKTIDENEKKLYWYNDKLEREEVTTETDECCGECSGECCQKDKKAK